MNQEEYLVRKKPEIKILLSDSALKIHNKSYPDQSAKFYYKEIQNIKIDYKKINWISTIISHVFVFLGVPVSRTFKSTDLEIVFTNKGSKKVSLTGCNLDNVEKVINLVNKRIRTETYT